MISSPTTWRKWYQRNGDIGLTTDRNGCNVRRPSPLDALCPYTLMALCDALVEWPVNMTAWRALWRWRAGGVDQSQVFAAHDSLNDLPDAVQPKFVR